MPLITIFAVSIVGAYWVASDAKSRGMRAKWWALLMLLTSMIALPVYLVARRNHSNDSS